MIAPANFKTPAALEQEAAATHRAGLATAAADAWRPRVRVSTDRWATQSFRLAPEVEGSGGRLDLTNRPWWTEILETFDDPEVRGVTIEAATQVGKTLITIATILAAAEQAPAPGLVCLPDRDAAIEFRDRLYLNALASPAIRDRVPPVWKWNLRFVDLGTMRVYLAWSGSRQRLRGRPCRYVWLSEIDVYQEGDRKAGNPINAAAQRVKAFYRYLIWRESSPSPDPSAIDALEAAAGDRRRWNAPCPYCGHHQEARFFPHTAGPYKGRGGLIGYKDDAGELLDPEFARANARYQCEKNGCEIEPGDKARWLEAGQWISRGQSIDRRGRVRGDRPTNRREIAYRLWSIHSDAVTLGDLAAEYVEHHRDGRLPEFSGNWLGYAHQPPSKLPEWQTAARRLALPGHFRGRVPADCWFLTAGADVQADEVLYVVRAWAPGATSYLVDFGALPRSDGDGSATIKSDLRQLGGILAAAYQVDGLNPLDQQALRLRLLNVDANYRTLDVFEWIHSLDDADRSGEDARVRAVRGDHQLEPSKQWQRNSVERNVRTNEPYPDGAELWGVYVYPIYEDLAERIAAGRPEPRADGSPGPGGFYLPEDIRATGRRYLRQLVNFHATTERRPDGRQVRVWKPKNSTLGNDFWDCEVYAQAAARMVVGTVGWSERTWRETWTKPKPKRGRRRSRTIPRLNER